MNKQKTTLPTHETNKAIEDEGTSSITTFVHREAAPPVPSACDNVAGDVVNTNPNHIIDVTGDVVNANPGHTVLNVNLPSLKETLPLPPSGCVNNIAHDPTAAPPS